MAFCDRGAFVHAARPSRSVSTRWFAPLGGDRENDDARGSARAIEAARALDVRDMVIDTDLGAGLRRARPDVVVDVTPAEAQQDVTRMVLAAGAAVLGEQPMAANPERARAMVAAADRARNRRSTSAAQQERVSISV
jgi:predicted dehydrogenase